VTGCGPDNWDSIPSEGRGSFLLHDIQTGSENHLANYSKGAGSSSVLNKEEEKGEA
jgi:hypothetical protein